MNTSEVKLQTGRYLIPVKVKETNGRLYFDFPYNKEIKDEIKMMAGHKWHGYDEVNPQKIWSVKKCDRNFFQLAFLQRASTGHDPYALFDSALDIAPFPLERSNKSKQKVVPLFAHTPEMAAHMYQRRGAIVAGEMGTAKTIACILAMELVARGGLVGEIMYVAPRSALRAVEREFIIWGCELRDRVHFLTYEGMTKWVKDRELDQIKVQLLVLDESSKVKNATSQRSQAAQIIADQARFLYGERAYIWLMTGTPAPKDPTNWWSQAEIARPGFLKEGDIYKFKNRLGIVVQKQDLTGGSYPVLVSWRNNEKLCNVCGQEQVKHLTEVFDHGFVPSKDEVAGLYRRLKGLVYIKFKKDCFDLPDKNYRIIELKPSASVLRTAKTLARTARTAIEGLTKLRELSDGFQYVEVEDGTEQCELCHGDGVTDIVDPSVDVNYGINVAEPTMIKGICPNCKGKGSVKKYIRTYKEIASPKDDALVDLLDEFEDIGRVVIYAGFSASIDRVVKLCLKQKWAVIRVDQGRDVIYDSNGAIVKDTKDYLTVFQDELVKYPRVAFVAHPGSAGMGLTLTASPVIIYFSNDFNGESRIQSEDRIHRPGMDVNRGATIIDLVHLPSDQKVLDNLKKKRELQAATLGEVAEMLGTTDEIER